MSTKPSSSRSGALRSFTGVFLISASILVARWSFGSPEGGGDDAAPQAAPQVRAFRALGDLGVDARPPAREKIVRQIIEGLAAEEGRLEQEPGTVPDGTIVLSNNAQLLHQIRDAALTALVKIGKVAEEALPLYAEALKSRSATTRAAGALVVAARGLDAKELLSRVFKEAPIEHVVSFYETVLPTHRGFSAYGKDDLPDPQLTRRLARLLAKEHGEPKVRAVSLSFAVVLGRTGNDYQLDLDLLKDVFATDPEILVKRAALRIAGALGHRPGGLDLKQVIREEKNPLLLKDAIEARSAWSERGFSVGSAVELWDGRLCDWIPGKSRWGPDWDEEELQRVFRVLREEKDPDLRDAASMALAERHRGWGHYLSSGDRKAPQPRAVPDLKVHEWGVFLDAERTLIPPERVLADLPSFVHRSNVGADELWAARSYMPTVVTKPVLFFHAPEPLSLLIQVHFHEGRPWTYYPHATNYLETTEVVGHSSVGTMQGETGRKVIPLSDGPGLRPDWLKLSPAPPRADRGFFSNRTGQAPENLRRFYRVASWLHPNHPEHATMTGQGPVYFTGMGIEWCGLRVGYPDAVDGGPRPVPDGSWWSYLREVPCDSVALRGEREKFLFYDGAANVRSPVLVKWRDASRSAISLWTRSFGTYPAVAEGVRRAWLGGYRESDTVRESEEYPDAAPLPAVFVVLRKGGEPARGWVLENLGSQAGPLHVVLDSEGLSDGQLSERLTEKLRVEGLTAPEAKALLRTWEKEFFQDAGLRVITLLPRWFYDAMLPIEIHPAPGELRRVGLVLKECRELETAAAAPRDRACWTARPVKVVKTAVEVEEKPFPLGETTPFVIGPDGKVASLPSHAFPLTLSGNGKSILFLRERAPTGLFLADLEKRTVSLVVQDDGRKHLPGMDAALSGNGQRVFLDTDNTLEVFDIVRHKVFAVQKGNHCSEIHVSEDGERAAWSNNERNIGELVSVLDLARREIWQVEIPDSPSGSWSRSCGGRLALSRDGTKLACVAASDGQDDVWLIDLERETMLNISVDPAIDGSPCLAQGGRLVLFSSERDRRRSIYLADVEDSTLVRISEEGQGTRPWITEDGSKVFFALEGALWKKDMKTGREAMILSSEEENVRVASISSDGRRALVRWIRRDSRQSRCTFHELGEQ